MIMEIKNKKIPRFRLRDRSKQLQNLANNNRKKRRSRVFLRFYNAISSLNTWSTLTSFDDFC